MIAQALATSILHLREAPQLGRNTPRVHVVVVEECFRLLVVSLAAVTAHHNDYRYKRFICTGRKECCEHVIQWFIIELCKFTYRSSSLAWSVSFFFFQYILSYRL